MPESMARKKGGSAHRVKRSAPGLVAFPQNLVHWSALARGIIMASKPMLANVTILTILRLFISNSPL